MLAADYMLTRPAGVRSVVFASPALSVSRWIEDAATLKKALSSSAGVNMSVYGTMWGPNEVNATGVLRTYERAEQLKILNVPVLVTAGRYDEATPSTTAYYASVIPGARVTILENSAHLTMQDEPDAYVRVVRDFIRDVESR